MGHKHKNKVVSFSMTSDMTEALCDTYEGLAEIYNPEGPHDLLLFGHITELRDKLKKMVDNDQHKYTLSFTGTEALAFVQVWEPKPVALPIRGSRVIQFIFDKLDHKANNNRGLRKGLIAN